MKNKFHTLTTRSDQTWELRIKYLNLKETNESKMSRNSTQLNIWITWKWNSEDEKKRKQQESFVSRGRPTANPSHFCCIIKWHRICLLWLGWINSCVVFIDYSCERGIRMSYFRFSIGEGDAKSGKEPIWLVHITFPNCRCIYFSRPKIKYALIFSSKNYVDVLRCIHDQFFSCLSILGFNLI